MNQEIKDIPLSEFNLSLLEMRVLNMTRILKVEKSMKLHGQLQPVIVRLHHGTYQLIDGFKRYYSAEDLMMESLHCRVLDIDLGQAKVLLLSYNRLDGSMEIWEEAMVLRDLQQTHGIDQKQLAKLTGYSRSWVSRRLLLIDRIDEKVCSRIKMGLLTGSHARALAKLPRGNQEEVARVIEERALTSRQSETLVEAFLGAIDSQQKNHILNYPEQVFMEEEGIGPEPYDARISLFGNKLLELMWHVNGAVQMACLRLQDRGASDLSQPEGVMLAPKFQEVLEACKKLIESPVFFTNYYIQEKR